MNRKQLARRSARHYLKSHLGLLAGSSIASAILVGALVVGDSVRITLRERALARLAGASLVLNAQDRFFRADLLDRLAAAPPSEAAAQPWFRLPASARGFCALDLAASAGRPDDAARANRVRALGVDPAGFPALAGARADQVWLNAALARQLRVGPGDSVVLRVRKPGALSGDAAITPRDDASVALRLAVAGILSAREGGDWMLAANQQEPFNAFLRLDALGVAAGVPGTANLAVVRAPGAEAATPLQALGAALDRRLREVWELADSELAVRVVRPAAASTGGVAAPSAVELVSRRIFIDPDAGRAATDGRALRTGYPAPLGVTTYLVNALEAHGGMAPYSMVTAAGPPYTPPDMADDEIIVNQWLAEDLGLRPGDAVKMAYYQADAARLAERTAQFKVRAVVPMTGAAVDGTLMPEFPGISKAESTHDWNSGFDLVHPIRDKDEAYWKAWRGAPKAFVSPKTGVRLWGNRFGDWTAVRWPFPPGAPAEDLGAAARALGEALRPATFPAVARFQPLRAAALDSAAGGQDFGGLFLGFSFFLIVAALLLVAMLFRFSLESRARELGILLALGWAPKAVRALIYREALWIAGVGGLAGVGGGAAYGWAILAALGSIWRDATGGARLEFHPTAQALAGGALLGAACSAMVVWFSLRRLVRRPARELLSEGRLESDTAFGASGGAWRFPAGAALLLAATVWTAAALSGGGVDPAVVFGAGGLFLAGGLTSLAAWLRSLARPGDAPAGPASMALRALARRPGRTLGAATLVASAVFLLGAVGAYKRDASRDAESRSSGTGGFAFWAESSLPVYADLNTPRGRDFFGMDAARLADAAFVAMKVRDGDEASCLNLNRAGRPRLLGVHPEALESRRAFVLAEVQPGALQAAGWRLLESDLPPEDGVPVIPAFGDAEGIQFIMNRKLGDKLDYTDGAGRPFKVQLVGGLENSILQGSLIISESRFERLFPGEGGHRAFLIDAPAAGRSALAAELTRAMRDAGLETTPAAVRLAAFNAVQNTYLDTFQALGGLGLLLGGVGLGVVVRRNLLERRGEFALLIALGYRPARIVRLALIEHVGLLGLGLGIGALASMPAVVPSALRHGAGSPWPSFVAMLVVVSANGAVWSWLAARAALRGRTLDALGGV